MEGLKRTRRIFLSLAVALVCLVGVQPTQAVTLPDLGLSLPVANTTINAFNLKVTYDADGGGAGIGLLTIQNDSFGTGGARGQHVILDPSASVAQHIFDTVGSYSLTVALKHDGSSVTVDTANVLNNLEVKSDLQPSDGADHSLDPIVLTTIFKSTHFLDFGGADSHMDLTWVQDNDVTSPVDLADVRTGFHGGSILLVGDLFNANDTLVKTNTSGSPDAWDITLFDNDFSNRKSTSRGASIGKADNFIPEPTSMVLLGAACFGTMLRRKNRRHVAA